MLVKVSPDNIYPIIIQEVSNTNWWLDTFLPPLTSGLITGLVVWLITFFTTKTLEYKAQQSHKYQELVYTSRNFIWNIRTYMDILSFDYNFNRPFTFNKLNLDLEKIDPVTIQSLFCEQANDVNFRELYKSFLRGNKIILEIQDLLNKKFTSDITLSQLDSTFYSLQDEYNFISFNPVNTEVNPADRFKQYIHFAKYVSEEQIKRLKDITTILDTEISRQFQKLHTDKLCNMINQIQDMN